MTVTNENRTQRYYGNDTTGPFAIPFPFQINSDIVLTKIVGAVSTVLIEGGDYTISGSNVTLTVALATGETLDIARTLPFTQDSDLIIQGRTTPLAIEAALDRLQMQMQQLRDFIYNNDYLITNVTLADDSHTVDTFHASATAQANTIAVRNASSKVPGDITGDSATVGGYTPDVAATANRIPVRNGSAKIPGDITGDAQTLQTYQPKTDTTANSIVVRNASGIIPGDITGSAGISPGMFNNSGFQLFAVAGDNSFIVPSGVTKVLVYAIGGGGGGGNGSNGTATNGGNSVVGTITAYGGSGGVGAGAGGAGGAAGAAQTSTSSFSSTGITGSTDGWKMSKFGPFKGTSDLFPVLNFGSLVKYGAGGAGSSGGGTGGTAGATVGWITVTSGSTLNITVGSGGAALSGATNGTVGAVMILY